MKAESKDIEESPDGEPLLISTALQYFSNFQNVLIQKFRDHKFFEQFTVLKKGENPSWVTKIRCEMRAEMERDLICSGIPLVLKPKGIGRDGMIDICKTLYDGGIYMYQLLCTPDPVITPHPVITVHPVVTHYTLSCHYTPPCHNTLYPTIYNTLPCHYSLHLTLPLHPTLSFLCFYYSHHFSFII